MSNVRLPLSEAESPEPNTFLRARSVPTTPSLMDTLERFEVAHRRQSTEDMRACFHDEAVIESVASYGQPLGADETIEALRAAFNDGVYSIGDWEYQQITPATILSWTGARHRRAGSGMSDETVCRVVIGRDGLMWRVKLFNSTAEALAYLRQETDRAANG